MQQILSLVWFKIYPPLFGGQKGVALFNNYLSRHFEVDCLCSRDNAILKNMGCAILPELKTGKSGVLAPANWLRIRQQLRKNYTYLIVEFPYYGLAGALLKKKNTRLIIHTHNIEALRFKSLKHRAWKLLYFYERWVFGKADLVLFKTEEERFWARNEFCLKPQKTYVLPYGIERVKAFDKAAAQAEICKRHGLNADEKILLFAGTLDYGPNADAVTLLFQRIEPLLRKQLSSYKILVCGRNRFTEYGYLIKLQNDNIIYVGEAADIDTYFAAADVFLNPVQNVHGVQTKLFDALNFNLNVVSFSNAARGLPTWVNERVFVAKENDYEAFARSTVNALQATFATPEAFYREFSWEEIVRKFAVYLNEQPASV